MVHALIIGTILAMPRADVHAAEAQAATSLYYHLNEERRGRGLAPLALDARLSEAAVKHVVDMSSQNYFAHESASGESPFDRMREAGCSYRFAGENLALAPGEREADSALFASAPHRRNTLSPNYRRVGIAVMFNADGELLFVEDFSD